MCWTQIFGVQLRIEDEVLWNFVKLTKVEKSSLLPPPTSVVSKKVFFPKLWTKKHISVKVHVSKCIPNRFSKLNCA